jgi:NAD(P)-dependent dehydrogenase (short-subunit alcohol dehydrogenase family)
MVVFANKVVVVTGASRGIGLEFVKQCLDKNNIVIAACREPKSAAKLQSLQPNDALSVTQLDVTSPSSISSWTQKVLQLTPHIDLLINNAGIYGERISFNDATQDAMLQPFVTNAIGPLLITQALYKAGLLGGPSSSKSSHSTIANITSKMGSVDDNGSGGSYGYRASKAALNIINKSMSIDLGEDNCTSVLLHPGWVRTDMVNNNGLIDTSESVSGMLAVLESGRPLNGCWYDFAGKEIPW